MFNLEQLANAQKEYLSRMREINMMAPRDPDALSEYLKREEKEKNENSHSNR